VKIAKPRKGEPIKVLVSPDGRRRYRVVIDGEPYPDGKRRQVTSTHATLTSARAYVESHRTDLGRGALIAIDKRGSQQFDEFANSWLDARVESEKIRANTAVGYRSALRRANKVFGRKELAQVTQADVERMAQAMARDGLTARSSSFTLYVVAAVFKDAVRRKVIARDPSESIEVVGRPSRSRDALMTEDLSRLRSQLQADRLYGCWLLTLLGLRRSEVMALRWSDIDLEDGTVRIERGRVLVNGSATTEGRPKTRRGRRTLPLPDELVTALTTMRDEQREALGNAQIESGYIAVNAAGKPVRPEQWSKLWRKHCQAAGVASVTLHAARHTSVTAMRDAGVADHIVAAWHGHDEVVMRRTYSHAHRSELAAAGAALAEVFGRPAQEG
jgi:integrase